MSNLADVIRREAGLLEPEELTEQELHGNRTYWHGSHTDKEDSSVKTIDKLNPYSQGDYECIFFSSYFGYSLAYALELKNKRTFAGIKEFTDKILIEGKNIENNGKNWWMIPFKITPYSNIFHPGHEKDIRVLWGLMGSSSVPEITKWFYSISHEGIDSFKERMKVLKTIDWYDEIPRIFPFDRTHLLKVIYEANNHGHSVYCGFCNYEKGDFSSIGLFKDKISSNLKIGPSYKAAVELDEKNEPKWLSISR